MSHRLLCLVLALTFGCLANDKKMAPFALNDVVKILLSEKPTSVAAFLESPKISSELRRNVLLLNNSDSLQLASAQCPRVLMHNRDSSLVMSFNCGTLSHSEIEAHSANSIEIAWRNPRTGDYENHSLYLSSAEKPYIQSNPEICLNCHWNQDTPSTASSPDWMDAEQVKAFQNFLRTQPPHFESTRRYKALNLNHRTPHSTIRSTTLSTWKRP